MMLNIHTFKHIKGCFTDFDSLVSSKPGNARDAKILIRLLPETRSITTELWVSPVGWLPSSMGTLSGELRECAAHTQVAGVAAAAAHVQHAGLDVMLRVDSLAA